jgi:L-ribulokinase
MAAPLFLGLDFGTESVRAVLVDRAGRTAGSAVAAYEHGQIVPGSQSAGLVDGLLPGMALQHPGDWVISAVAATRGALEGTGAAQESVAGIGVDFTSCTMLPCARDGRPLCLSPDGQAASRDPHAWPKLWKHHGAIEQTARINEVARERREAWLGRYGGAVGLEWFFPKMLEVIERSPAVAEEAEVWLEGGDWLVWMLVGAPWIQEAGQGAWNVNPEGLGTGSTGHRPVPRPSIEAADLPRSTCQAGYKALWSAEGGFPSQAYLAAVHPELARAAAEKMPGRFVAPGKRAGELCAGMAARMGLRQGVPVSAAIIDAHAGVPGAGVGEAGTLVMVMGTSGCHMLLGHGERLVPGVPGVVRDGILPGFAGYETGQAAMGDGFDLVRRLTGAGDFVALEAAAERPRVGAGADGVLCLDWFNGCRTPLMDGSLSGGFAGLKLHHGPEHLYRAALEASACGLRWIVETLREGGVPVERFVATGGLARRNRLFMKIVASVLGAPVLIHGAEHGPALGAAILGALAAGAGEGGFDDVQQAVETMAGAKSAVPAAERVEPVREWARIYDRLYKRYRRWAEEAARSGSVMRM